MKKKLDIVYEDKDIIVVNKPANLLCISTDKVKEHTLYHEVSLYVKKSRKNAKIFVVHRLDKDTSGLILFAKNQELKLQLQNNWNDLCLEREYIAIVHGKPLKNKGRIESYLKDDKFLRVYSSQDKINGKKAITNYEVMCSNKDYSLLRITIETGRKNQIRVHMHDLKTSIVGDKKYGIKDKAPALLLHASTLIVRNPLTNKEMIFKSEIPKYFNNFIKK